MPGNTCFVCVNQLLSSGIFTINIQVTELLKFPYMAIVFLDNGICELLIIFIVTPESKCKIFITSEA